MASVFIYHVIGDLTVGKPDLVEFYDDDTVEAAIRAIWDSAEGAITVWRRPGGTVAAEPRAARFVGMLNALDLVGFIARAGEAQAAAMQSPVSEVVVSNPGLLKEVDPGTRLIDALEMMKQGVRRLLVRKSIAWKGFSKRFSVLYHGRWLKTVDSFSSSSNQLSLSPHPDENYCCLSREDVARFLIGCLGALAPIPLSSISALGAISPHYTHIEASTPALEAIKKIPHDPCAIAVVETYEDGTHKIIGEISSYKLWKCDYSAAAWGMGNLSAGQYVMGSEEDGGAKDDSFLDASFTSPAEDPGANIASPRSKIFSSRSIGFFNSHMAVRGLRPLRSMYRGRSAPLTCKTTNSLAAVMAQMLSHRATHVWVTEAEAEENDILVGVVSYSDILYAVTKNPGSIAPPAS